MAAPTRLRRGAGLSEETDSPRGGWRSADRHHIVDGDDLKRRRALGNSEGQFSFAGLLTTGRLSVGRTRSETPLGYSGRTAHVLQLRVIPGLGCTVTQTVRSRRERRSL